MTKRDDTDPTPKQLRAAFTELQNHVQQVLAINQFQRQALQALAAHHWEEEDDTLLLGLSLTDQWQTHQEQRLKQRFTKLQQQV